MSAEFRQRIPRGLLVYAGGKHTPPRWFRLWMLTVSRLGNGALWGMIGLALLLSRETHAFDAAALAVLFGQIASLPLKRWAKRSRPEPAAWHPVRPWRFDSYSFPSGHSVTGFAVASAVSAFLPHWEPALVFCAVTVAVSRVVLRLHYVSDVVVGCLLGYGCGELALFCLRRV